MKFSKRILWKTASWTAGCIVLVLFVYRFRETDHSIPDSDACISETLMTLQNIADGDVEVINTNCDTLAKEDWISIYISSKSGIKKLLAGKTLLFRYDPGAPTNPLPSIKSAGQNKIFISVPVVSSILFQQRRWGSIPVDYWIGKNNYPDPDPAASQHLP